MNAKKAPPRTSGVRQQPVGTNHFQLRLHQPAGGWGMGVPGGGEDSISSFSSPAGPKSRIFALERPGTFVTTYINVTKGMKEQMKKLVDANTLTKNDSQFVQNTIDVLDLVLKEAKDLQAYIESGDKSDAEAYDGSRKKALKAIKTLLSIKD